MVEIATKHSADLHVRGQIALLSAAAALLIALTAWTANSLYFVWEEWGHLWDAVESPALGLMQSFAGYVSPIGRLVFLVEAKIFGHWYVGYALVNALLLITVVFLIWRNFRSANPWSSWALTGGLIAFMLSGGALFAVNFAAMDAYFLCWLFGLLALGAWRQRRSIWVVALLLLMAALSSSLMNVVVAAFVMPAMVALGRLGEQPQWSWQRIRGPLGYATFSAAASLALYLIGRSFPSVDPLVAVEQVVVPAASAAPLEQVLPVASLLAVWFLAPFLGVLALDQNLYQRAIILFLDRPYLTAIVVFIVASVLALTFSRRLSGVGWRQGLLALVLLTSALGFALQLVFFRGDQGFEVRYTLMWLPAIVVFWARWVDLAQLTRLRVIAQVGAVAMVVSGLIVLSLSPFFVDQAVDLIRPRTERSLELKEAVLQCGTITEPAVSDVLAPGMSWEDVCDAASFLRR